MTPLVESGEMEYEFNFVAFLVSENKSIENKYFDLNDNNTKIRVGKVY